MEFWKLWKGGIRVAKSRKEKFKRLRFTGHHFSELRFTGETHSKEQFWWNIGLHWIRWHPLLDFDLRNFDLRDYHLRIWSCSRSAISFLARSVTTIFQCFRLSSFHSRNWLSKFFRRSSSLKSKPDKIPILNKLRLSNAQYQRLTFLCVYLWNTRGTK